MMDDPVDWSAPGIGAGRRFLVGQIPSVHGGVHRVVLALMSDMGNNSAAISATRLLESFPRVRHFIMCGIAGGVPRFGLPEHDVRLGDIVVSDRNGVVQYDLVKEKPDGSTEMRHPPRPPGAELLEATRHIQVEEELSARPWQLLLQRGAQMKAGERPPDDVDAQGKSIAYPEDPNRQPGFPRVFYATVAAANRLLKNPTLRDHLGDAHGVKAVEMESSGVADASWYSDRAGYLVIRGICDYCDGQKGDLWQGAAAVAAAAYTRTLVSFMHNDKELTQVNLSGGAGERPQAANSRHNVLLICGMSSVGKDALLSHVANTLLEGLPVNYLSRFTNRAIRPDEEEATEQGVRPIPYLVERIGSKRVRDAGVHFGIFSRGTNHYAFSKEELKRWLLHSEPRLIVGVYSGPADSVPELKQDIEHLVVQATSLPGSPSLADVHVLLIDASLADCKRRIDCRNLDRASAHRKKRYVVQDATDYQELVESGFFDEVIDNSDSIPFSVATKHLSKYLVGLTKVG